MWHHIRSIRPKIWWVLFMVLVVTVACAVLHLKAWVPAQFITYLILPVSLAVVSLFTWRMVGGVRARVRHVDEKILRITSMLVVWFVIYMLSGLVFTYDRNALVPTPASALLNILAFGTPAVAVEYIREKLMAASGRREQQMTGTIVAIVLALPFMNLGQFGGSLSASEVAGAVFVDIVGSLATSAILTYLSVTAGLKVQLVYRLGLLAMVLLLPVIPRHDWYMLGIPAVLLPLVTYFMLSHFEKFDDSRARRRLPTANKPVTAMFVIFMIALALFMTGVFTYKPMVIMSNSMLPVYGRGSVVVVQKARPVDIKVGDIVQYEVTGKMITHRVEIVKPDKFKPSALVFITKGDNSSSRDKPVSESQIIGIVRSHVPYVGYPTVWLQEMIKGRQSQ